MRQAHEIIQAHAIAKPSAQAVNSWDGDLTYAELDDMASRFAYHLAHHYQMRPGSLVPLYFEKSKWVLVALLAVLKTGGGFVLLDVSQPSTRTAGVVRQTKSPLILTSSANSEACRAFTNTVIVVEDAAIPRLPQRVLGAPQDLQVVSPDSVAYAIFTSGSTGDPKGVLIEHSHLVTSSTHHGGAMGFSNKTRTLQFASYTFDACILEMMTTLLHGGTVCIPSEWERQNDLANAMTRLRVTCAFFTPSLLRSICLDGVHTLDTLMVGGEKVPSSVVEQWAFKVRLMLVYGPTETTVACFILEAHAQSYQAGDLGRPVGCRAWVVRPDNVNKLVNRGEVGELIIEGPIVARGYLGDPLKTARSFIPNPSWMSSVISIPEFANSSEGRLYRTGDLVRLGENASIRYVGRMDTQVKIHGQRLEIGEVESQLQHCVAMSPDTMVRVEHVLVDAIVPPGCKNNNGDSLALVAFLCLQDQDRDQVHYLDWSHGGGSRVAVSPPNGGSGSITDENIARLTTAVTKSLRLLLPEYAVPTFFIPLCNLPYAISGKANRKLLREAVSALRAQDFAIFSTGSTTAAHAHAHDICDEKAEGPPPATLEPMRLVWASVFGLESSEIKNDAHFLGLRGDSLLAIRLVCSARARRLNLTVHTVLKHPRLYDMAAAVAGRGESAEPTSPNVAAFDMIPASERVRMQRKAVQQCGIHKEQILDMYPCSALQKLWIKGSLAASKSYQAQFVFALSPDFDVLKFKLAWAAIARTQPLLRTRLIDVNVDVNVDVGTAAGASGVFQVVEDANIIWNNACSLEEYLQQDSSDIMTYGSKLQRYCLIKSDSAARPQFFVWSSQHSTYDAWSISLLYSLLEAEYFCPGSGCDPAQPSFNRFIQHITGTGTRRAAASFWKAQLAGAATRPLYSARELANAGGSFALLENRRSITLPARETQTLTSATLAVAIELAWSVVVSRELDTPDVVLQVISSGRGTLVDGIEDIVAPTATLLPVRICVDLEMRVRDALYNLQQLHSDLLTFEHFGWEEIAALGNDEALACQNAVGINILPAVGAKLAGGIGMSLVSSHLSFQFPFYTIFEPGENSVQMKVLADERVVPNEKVQRLMRRFEGALGVVLEAANGNGDQKLGQVSKAEVSEMGWGFSRGPIQWLED